MIKNAYKILDIRYINFSVNNFKINKKFDLITAVLFFHWFGNVKINKLFRKI
jgi:hypothetical protein